MDKLFEAVKEGHDSRNRIVFICKDANGFYVQKPQTGFRSKHWPADNDPELLACYDRVCGCGHPHPFYAENERPAEGEGYPAPGTASAPTKKVLTPEQLAAKKEAAEKKAAAAAKKEADKAAAATNKKAASKKTAGKTA